MKIPSNPSRRRVDSSLKAACLSASLATAWASGAAAQQGIQQSIQLTQTSAQVLTNVYFLYGGSSSGSNVAEVIALNNFAGPGSQTFTATPPSLDSGDNYVFSLIAFYSFPAQPTLDGSGTNFSLSFQNSAVPTPGASFASLFPGFTATQISIALTNGDTTTLANFFNDPTVRMQLGTTFAQDGSLNPSTLINFNPASPSGDLSAQVVPEPNTVILLIAGAAGLALRVYRRRPRRA